MSHPNLPGRLGNPNLTVFEDPRIDPRVAAVLSEGGGIPEIESPGFNASYEQGLAFCEAFEKQDVSMHQTQFALMPDFSSVEQRTEIIKGDDDNDITLYIHRPKDVDGDLPCLVHTHGGGMVLMTATDPMFFRWRNSLAQTGIMVIGIEFRNGGGRLGNHPFPAGLNDCASGLRWVYSNREALDVSTIVISGESGGGNLSIATTLKALKEGWVGEINGVYAQCPYVSGDYANPPAELISLVENDGYTLSCEMMAPLVKVYDPDSSNSGNLLTWPLKATIDELEGLPPHAISVNELDPLRDEGLAYYRKLLAAGVSATARTINGTTHGADQGMADAIPEVFHASVEAVSSFVKSIDAGKNKS